MNVTVTESRIIIDKKCRNMERLKVVERILNYVIKYDDFVDNNVLIEYHTTINHD